MSACQVAISAAMRLGKLGRIARLRAAPQRRAGELRVGGAGIGRQPHDAERLLRDRLGVGEPAAQSGEGA